MRYIYVRYDEAAEPWHEHLSVAKVSAAPEDSRWVVYTADSDLYVEDFGVPPLREIRWGGQTPELPEGLGRSFGQPVCRFTAPVSASAKTALLRRAARLQEISAAPPATLPEASGSRPLLVLLPAAGLAIGSKFSVEQGDVVSGEFVVGERDGQVVVAQYVEDGQEESFVEAARARLESALSRPAGPEDETPGDDVRTLAVRYERTGERFRCFEESVGLMYEEPFTEEDWPLEGPRSAMWWLRATRRQGLTPTSRHNRWLIDSGVPAADRSTHEHEVLFQCIELAATVDQVNVGSLISFEFLVRRLQLIEEAHVMAPNAPSYDGSEHWMGSGRRKGGVLVSPALAKHVATRAREETEVAKERRKAKEERRMAPGRKGGGRGVDDAAAKDGK